jgi:hypothetical protein
MNKSNSNLHLKLDWTQPDTLERHFELRTTDSLLAILHFETVSLACDTIYSEVAEQESWTFSEEWRHFKPCIIIRKTGADENYAIYKPGFWGGGNVEFIFGTRFYWKTKGLCGAEWNFFNAMDELLFVLKAKRFDLIKVQSEVEITPQWHNLEELPLLMMLGCFLQVSGRNAAI